MHGPPRSLSRGSLRQLLGLMASHRRALAVGFAGLVLVDLLQLILPKITQAVVDRLARGTAEPRSLGLFGGSVVAVSLAMGACRFLWRYFLIGCSHRVERDLRQRFYEHLQTLSPSYYDRTKVGDIMAHASNDLGAVRMAVGMASLAAVDALVLAVATVSIMLAMSARLTVLVLIPLPLLTFLMMRFGSIVHARFTAVQEAFSRLTEKSQETIAGIRVVKSYGAEASEERSFSDRSRASAEENIRLARAWGIFGPLISALASASLAILIVAGGRMVIRGGITLGEMVAFTSYLHTLIWPMMAAGWVVNLLQRGTASLERLEAIFATRPEIADGSAAAAARADLECRGLRFAYPGTDREVLREVSFFLPAGATLGVVGRTGSGKTTLAELLLRLYDPPPGTVFLGGRDVRDLRLGELRATFGYVPQETFLFALSVAENIAFGVDHLDREEIARLARLVDLEEEILALPQGYDTLVGERGVTLSGGQKQRVAIARALARDPRVLILDDALSSVDPATENRILAALRAGRADRTNILFAHRTSTVRQADLILVLDAGRATALGTHEQLMAREGYYRDLHRMQQLEAEAREAIA